MEFLKGGSGENPAFPVLVKCTLPSSFPVDVVSSILPPSSTSREHPHYSRANCKRKEASTGDMAGGVRKYHTKSRNGCSQCKKRRKKVCYDHPVRRRIATTLSSVRSGARYGAGL